MDYPKVRGKRNELRITQPELAKRMGISLGAYNKKERGVNDFSLDEAFKLCEIFKCNFEDIFLNEKSSKYLTKKGE